MERAVRDWLLEGDPAVVWQVQRDLLKGPKRTYEPTRARVTTDGWGARLLSHRGHDGTWDNSLYHAKWTSTFYSLRLLYWFGVDGRCEPVAQSCQLLLERALGDDGGMRPWDSKGTDCCVNAMTLAMCVRFGVWDERLERMLDWLLRDQLADGGWNCQAHRKGCRVSSFHTTLSVLEALDDYTSSVRQPRKVQASLKAGHEYFLRHRVYRSETTGKVVKDSFTRFSFPSRWYFDVLRALDHFRAAGHPYDERLGDAIRVVQSRPDPAGLWRNQNFHPGKEHFKLEKTGAPSRWNTLRALRVLQWANNLDQTSACR